jgi:hypothetical protein
MAVITRGKPGDLNYVEGTCKAVKRRIKGQKHPIVTIRDGVEGTGVSLPFTCGFCKDSLGRPTVAFRSRKQRNQHTNFCPK